MHKLKVFGIILHKYCKRGLSITLYLLYSAALQKIKVKLEYPTAKEKVGVLMASPGSFCTGLGTRRAILPGRCGAPGAIWLSFPLHQGQPGSCHAQDCHVGDLLPSAGWESHRAVSTRGHSGISTLQHCSMCPDVMVALSPWVRLRAPAPITYFPPRDPWHDESDALSSLSPVKEGVMPLVRT